MPPRKRERSYFEVIEASGRLHQFDPRFRSKHKKKKTLIGKDPTNELYTPDFILEWLPAVDLDPCWSEHSLTNPRFYYDITSDGLLEEHLWVGEDIQMVFVNPPYDDLLAWTGKMVETANHESVPQVWGLLPAKPGERYWYENVWPTAFAVGFIKGRLKHGTPPGTKPLSGGTFNSALVLFDQDETRAEATLREVRAASEHHEKHPAVWVQRYERESSALVSKQLLAGR